MIEAFKDVLAFELASGRETPPDVAGVIRDQRPIMETYGQ